MDATEEPVENSDDVKYIFFVDSMTEVPQITIETSPKSILRVGYYDSQNKWHNNGDSSASTAAIQPVGQQIIIGRIHCRQMQTVVNM